MKGMTIYPSWRYHKSGAEKLVLTKEQDEALSEDWQDSPAKFEKVAEKPPKPQEGDKNEVPENGDSESYKDHMSKWESKEEKELIAEALKRGFTKKELKGKSKAQLIELLKGELA
jgi:hypothetical protein